MDFKKNPSSVDICRPGHLANPWRTGPKMAPMSFNSQGLGSHTPTFVIVKRSQTGNQPTTAKKKSVICRVTWWNDMKCIKFPTIYGGNSQAIYEGFTTWYDRCSIGTANHLPMIWTKTPWWSRRNAVAVRRLPKLWQHDLSTWRSFRFRFLLALWWWVTWWPHLVALTQL